MTRANSRYSYQAFGLNIDSEIPLPELVPLPDSNGSGKTERVSISYSELAAIGAERVEGDANFLVEHDDVLFRVPEIACFRVRNGTNVSVCPVPGANADQIRLYLLGSCLGIILIQRKILPLHGSAVAINGKAYAIVGRSGAGKSTLSTLLLQQGFRLISDDLIPIVMDEEDVPMAMPAYPQQKLWQQSLDELGIDSSHGSPLFDRETKFAIKVPSQFCSESLPLAGVFELIKTESKTAIRPIRTMERFPILLKHTYRGFLVKRLGLMEWHFQTLSRFVGKIKFYQLSRPDDRFAAPLLADYLLDVINKERNDHE